MNDNVLYAICLELLHKLSQKHVDIILGGGFGLYLKQMSLIEQPGERTLLPIDTWPSPRSTSDIDVFFPLKVLVNLADMQATRSIIDEMRFEPIAGSEYLQFMMPNTKVKIDLLTGPIPDSAKSTIQSDLRRARPKGDVQLHAHPVPEAIALSEDLETLSLANSLSEGNKYSTHVNLPSPFTYLMMKVTAFGDQVDKLDKDMGRHHAMDVYRIIAMLTEDQFSQTRSQFIEHSASPYVKRVKGLISDAFGNSRFIGIIRIKEHALFGNNIAISDFSGAILDLIAS